MKDNESSHQTTRYLLPCEMEPTATFSLFGSDFDLEYLPVIEAPAVISKQPSPPRLVKLTEVLMVCTFFYPCTAPQYRWGVWKNWKQSVGEKVCM
jgi:hypothetical protein